VSVKVFFAGAEEGNKAYPVMNRLKARYRLMSFYYLRTKSPAKQDRLLYDTTPSDVVYLIDSGAFTFFETHIKLAKKEPAKWWDLMERYVEDYVAFLNKHKKRIFACAEMDVDHVLSYDEIWTGAGMWAESLRRWWDSRKGNRLDGSEGFTPPPIAYWRERIMTAGIPVLVSWHAIREWRGWLDQCSQYRYLALPGGEEVSENRWFPYVNEARKNGVLIHGFAGTKPDVIRRLPFYTVDSTSWLMGSKFGTTAIFQNGRLRFHDSTKKQSIRAKHKHLYEKFGLNWKKIESEDPAEVDAANLLSWLQYATYLTTIPNKDYWTQELNGAPKDSLGPPTDLDAGELLGRSSGRTMVTDEAEAEAAGEDEGGMKKAVRELEEQRKAAKPDRTVVVAMPRPEEASLLPARVNGNGAAPLVQIASARTQEFVSKEEIVSSPMECNFCNMQDRCKFYEPDKSCYFRLSNTYANADDFLHGLRATIIAQQNRVMHALLQEKLDGGQLDRNLSIELDRLNEMIYNFKDFMMPQQESVEIKAKGGGAVSAILAALGPHKRPSKRSTIEAEAQPVEQE
jgi:hypothetical protein